MRRSSRLAAGGLAFLTALTIAACSSPTPATPSESGGDASAQSASVTAGWVSAIDQIGLPAALDQGYFDEVGLDVEIQEPFASGVDMLNALEADQIQFAQVGAPFIGAKISGADYVLVGNYTGSASQPGVDETMAVVARDGSGITEGDFSTLAGKRIGVTVGSINHLYLLAVLEDAGLSADDVEIVNTAAPDMAVALETSGVDAVVIWDPWPMTIQQQVEGTTLIARGGGHIGFLGFIVAKREFVEQNPEVVEQFLTARAMADQWMRENPDEAAAVASRWMTSLDPQIAQEAMQFNVQQLDPRISACNFAALDAAVTSLHELGTIEGTFDVNEVFVPEHIANVEAANPELFEDLPPVPAAAAIGEGFSFDPAAGQCG